MIMVELGNINNRVISQIAAERWNAESEPVKIWYRMMAKMGKEEHAINHPGYKYAPNKKLLDYPAQAQHRGHVEADEPDDTSGMARHSESKDAISDDDDDDDDYEDPTYGRKKSTKKNASNGVLSRKQQREPLRLPNSFSRQQSTRRRHKATQDDKDREQSQVYGDFNLGPPSQGTIDAATFLGPQSITGLGGGVHNDAHYHLNCDHGQTSLTGSFNPVADHQILVNPQPLYALQTQCCRVFQQHAFQTESQPPHPHQDLPFHLFDNYRHFPAFTGGAQDIYPQHQQQQHHESRQDWAPTFYMHSPGRHSFYDIEPEANASVETLVDPGNHWLVHRYYDPSMIKDHQVYHDSELPMEKDLPPLPMEITLETAPSPHAVLAQLSSTIYGLGPDKDGTEVALIPGSLYARARQDGHPIKSDFGKVPAQAGGISGQRLLIKPASPTYMSFTEASQM